MHVINVMDVPLWSTLHLSAGPVYGACLFNEPRGASLADTNMVEACRIPAGWDFEVHRAVWDIFGGTPEDREALLIHGAWSWRFMNTVIAQSPLTLDDIAVELSEPAPSEVVDRLGDGPALYEWTKLAERRTLRNELLTGSCVLSVPMALPADVCWHVELSVDPFVTFTSPVSIRMSLRGRYWRTIAFA